MRKVDDLHHRLVQVRGLAFAARHLDNEILGPACELSNARTCLLDELFEKIDACSEMADALSSGRKGQTYE